MRTLYHKLVCDRIPEILRCDGRTYEIVTMNEEEYRQALREKLIEEAKEATSASSSELVTELADLYQVIEALMQSYNITLNQVQTEQERRRIERGGFEQRIRLVWME
jgi:predicted house-cleaning noncanonical NTP pyrophosphatase (MazG superfamily)